jgi:L-amino acid N-acyltransferase YncA
MGELLRAAKPSDAEQILAIYAPVVLTDSATFEIDPPTVEEMEQRITETLKTYPWLVIENDGRILGYAYASAHHVRVGYQWSVNASVYVDSNVHRQGYGRRLYDALFRVLRAQGYYTVFAGIALPNESSVRLHEALGFEPAGVHRNAGYKFGVWRDVGWWRLPLREYDTPARPRPFPDLQANGDFQKLLTAS